MIKKIWTSPMAPHRPDRVMISVRFFPDTLISCNLSELPPSEEVDGKRLSITEAQQRRLVEPHLTLGYLDAEELNDLIVHLQGVLDTMPVHEDLS